MCPNAPSPQLVHTCAVSDNVALPLPIASNAPGVCVQHDHNVLMFHTYSTSIKELELATGLDISIKKDLLSLP